MSFKTRLWLSGAVVNAAKAFDKFMVLSFRTFDSHAPKAASPFMDLWLLALKAFRRHALAPFVGFLGGLIWGEDAMEPAK